MQVFTIFSVVLAFLTVGLFAQSENNPAWNLCLTDDTANQLAKAFVSISSGSHLFNKTVAEALLAPGFSDTSGSVSSIGNAGAAGPLPLLGPTFPNKTIFIAASAAQAPTTLIPLNLYHTCSVVTLRFQMDTKPQPVLGISILETAVAPVGNLFPHQITQVFGELNSAAFLVDLGTFKPANSSSSSKRDMGNLL